jgi:large subunit ribosomal protein L25
MYGGKTGNISLSVNSHDLHQIVAKGSWETTLIDLQVKQEKETTKVPVLIKDLQIDPVKRTLVHVDFLEITKGQTVEVHIPIELVGESVGVKAGGILEFQTRELAVECLPSDMVDHFEVDISALEFNDSITVSELTIGEEFKIHADPETVIVMVAPPVAEEVEEEEEEELAEPEVIQKGKQPEEE